MQIKVNADDYGLTRSITDRILSCYDHGVLDSVSIIPNGFALDYALAEYQKRKGLKLNIHLNLVEGKPLLPPAEVPLLVNKSGFFCHSFASLLFTTVFSGVKTRALLRDQIRRECLAQIERVTGPGRIDMYQCGVDSHLHLHMIPMVFKLLLGLYQGRTDLIRIPFEPFFLCADSFDHIKKYFGPNLIKHLLLKMLTAINLRKIQTAQELKKYFLGLLFAGSMDPAAVKKGLEQMEQVEQSRDDWFLEILFHPGYSEEGERCFLQQNMCFAEFYLAPARKKEFMALHDQGLRLLLNAYRKEREQAYEIIHRN